MFGCEGGEYGCYGFGVIIFENSNNSVLIVLEGRIFKDML